MNDEYDSQELEAIVKAALENPVKSKALFDAGGTRILESLEGILEEYLHPADRAFVLSQLRDVLYDKVPSDKADKERLKGLHAIQANCTVCPMAIGDPELPRWNLIDPQMAIVTDKPLSTYNGEATKLLIGSLKQSGFSSSRIAATSVVRCRSESNKIEQEMVNNCTSRYLFNELQLLSPQLIVACGSLAGSILASEQIKVTEEMGNVFWVGPWPVMVNTSPSFATNSPNKTEEFKDTFNRAFAFLNGNSRIQG